MSGQDFRPLIRRRAWLSMLLLLLVCVVLFSLARVTHARLDLTEDQIYTLSDSTRNLLTSLDEPVMIRAYITSGLPQPYGHMERFVRDMLQAYQDAGKGNVGFDVIDPSGDANVSNALAAMGVPKVQVQVVENDQAQVRQGYLAVVIEYLDSKETIPVVQGEEGFEYLLTRKIRKLTGHGKLKLGVAGGFGAADLYSLKRLKALLGEDYELVDVMPAAEEIPTDIRALIVAGVGKAPTQVYRYHLDQFRVRGGGVLLLAGNAKPDLSQGYAVQPVAAGANDWLKEDLQVAIEPGLVMDEQATRVQISQRQGAFLLRSVVEYPFIPMVEDLNAQHPATRGLEAVAIPFASPLQPIGEGFSILMRSSPFSSVQDGPPFDVDPLRSSSERFQNVHLRESVLAVAREGEVHSAFPAMPEDVDAPSYQAKGHGRLVVIGSPSLLEDAFVDGGNAILALNLVDWLAGEEGLIDLRSRGVTDRPLQVLSAAEKRWYKGLWMFGLPSFVALLGLWRWWRSRRRSAMVSAGMQ